MENKNNSNTFSSAFFSIWRRLLAFLFSQSTTSLLEKPSPRTSLLEKSSPRISLLETSSPSTFSPEISQWTNLISKKEEEIQELQQGRDEELNKIQRRENAEMRDFNAMLLGINLMNKRGILTPDKADMDMISPFLSKLYKKEEGGKWYRIITTSKTKRGRLQASTPSDEKQITQLTEEINNAQNKLCQMLVVNEKKAIADKYAEPKESVQEEYKQKIKPLESDIADATYCLKNFPALSYSLDALFLQAVKTGERRVAQSLLIDFKGKIDFDYKDESEKSALEYARDNADADKSGLRFDTLFRDLLEKEAALRNAALKDNSGIHDPESLHSSSEEMSSKDLMQGKKITKHVDTPDTSPTNSRGSSIGSEDDKESEGPHH